MRTLARIARAFAFTTQIAISVTLSAIIPVAVVIAICTWSFDPIGLAAVFGLGLVVIFTSFGEAIERLDEWAISILSVPASAPSVSGPTSGGC